MSSNIHRRSHSLLRLGHLHTRLSTSGWLLDGSAHDQSVTYRRCATDDHWRWGDVSSLPVRYLNKRVEKKHCKSSFPIDWLQSLKIESQSTEYPTCSSKKRNVQELIQHAGKKKVFLPTIFTRAMYRWNQQTNQLFLSGHAYNKSANKRTRRTSLLGPLTVLMKETSSCSGGGPDTRDNSSTKRRSFSSCRNRIGPVLTIRPVRV